MSTTTVIIAGANAVTLVLGGAIAYLGWRAYRRTEAGALRALAVGIGLVAVGTAAGGLLHQFTDAQLTTAVAIQSVFVAIGFAILAYSLSRTADMPSIRGRLPIRSR